jgi:hypothetical protein
MSRPSQQEIDDMRNAPKMDKAYMDSLTSTEASSKANPRDAVRGQKGYAKGGSASSRADGIAQRGKTRGTMVMCGGGMARGKK